MSHTKKTRWGILSAADIARKNWKSILNSGSGVVAAVASRDRSQARAFVEACQSECPMPEPPAIFGSYEELLADPNIDAVYVPIPTGLRGGWVQRAAAAGKHVMCEKPCARDATELSSMIESCRKAGVQFMDGVMFMHSRRLQAMKDVVWRENGVGTVRRITSAFSFCGDDGFFANNIRLHSGLEPHGSLGDLGWYCIRYTLAMLGEKDPVKVIGRILKESRRADSPGPVPVEMSAEMFFADGVSAGFYCSFEAGDQQWARVSGTTGSLVVEDFVLPVFGAELLFEVRRYALQKYGCDFNLEAARRICSVPEYSNSHANAQESLLFRRFNELAQSGKPDPSWPEISLRTQRVLDAILKSGREGGTAVGLD